MRLRAIATIAALGALAVPASASAHRFEASAGAPGEPPRSAPDGAELDAFFPGTIRIRAGDSIRWRVSGFHTITVLGRGDRIGLPVIPDPSGARYEGIADAAGNPFHFNGRTKWIWNPRVFAPEGSTTIRDRRTHSSGPLAGRNASATFRFTRPGTYRVLCLIHPGMEQRVVVLPRRSRRRADTDAGVRSRALRESASAWDEARRVARAQPRDGETVLAGAGRRGTLLRFLPGRLSVRAGTVVTFENRAPAELHNLVFGPQEYVDRFFGEHESFPMGPGTPNQVSPATAYGSDPAVGGVLEHDGQNHGNGFLVTPVTLGARGAGVPTSSRIRFTRAGTYRYFCAIHGPEMSGEIEVVP